MAIYKRAYAPYVGRLTPRGRRFFILTRYTYARMLQSNFLMLFMALCLVYPIGCLAFIYLANNPSFLAIVPRPILAYTTIDGRFFYYFCVIQGTMAYLLTALVGPGLVAPDLVNGGLPLYLSRPLSRTEYVVGKMTVLAFALSLITWMPGLCLFLVKASLSGWVWLGSNLWLGGAILLGSVIWIAVLSLIALALSAWIKWRIIAGALVLGVFFAGAGAGAAINGVLRTTNGSLLDLTQVVHTIWSNLFRFDNGTDMPLTHAWAVLLLVSSVSGILLVRRIRPFEVIK